MRLRPAGATLLALALAGLAATGAARHWLEAAAPDNAVPAMEEALDLNRASARELSGLPGLGPSLAKRIIRRRQEGGRFSRPEDLLDIAGIGPRKLARWRPQVRVAGHPSPPPAAGENLQTGR